MKSLIVTTDDSAAGWLKQSRIADRVIAFPYRLVSGPVPALSKPAAFFAERARRGGADIRIWEDDDTGSWLIERWSGLIGTCRLYDRIEIWPDPDPNSQVQLLQLLDWFGAHPDIAAKLALVSVDFQIGERRAEEILPLVPALRAASAAVSDAQFRIAQAALRAFQQASPEAWFDLLRSDLASLPRLRPTVVRLLEELPAVDTGLTAAEARLLEIISAGPLGVDQVFIEYFKRDQLFDHWAIGKALDRFARGDRPAILGLAEGPFTLELHDDGARFRRYRDSRLSLSPFGQDLIERRADFAQHNAIDRWWGGTQLTNDRLWRWDGDRQALVAPAVGESEYPCA
jgi:hypothetical protein